MTSVRNPQRKKQRGAASSPTIVWQRGGGGSGLLEWVWLRGGLAEVREGGGSRWLRLAACGSMRLHAAACGDALFLFLGAASIQYSPENFPTAFTESNCTHNFFKWLKNALAESCKICSATPLPIAAQAPRVMICSSGRRPSWVRKAARITAECFFSLFSFPLTVRRPLPLPLPRTIRCMSVLSDTTFRRSVQAS